MNPQAGTQSSSRRGPQYLTSNVRTIGIAVNGGPAQQVPVGAGSAGCGPAVTPSEYTAGQGVPGETRSAVLGNDGNMWVLGDSSHTLTSISPSGTFGPALTFGADLTWTMGIDRNDGSFYVGQVFGGGWVDHADSTGSSYSQISESAGYAYLWAQGGDGAMYFLVRQFGGAAGLPLIGRIAGGVYDNAYATATYGNAIVKSTDGSIWYATNTGVGRMAMGTYANNELNVPGTTFGNTVVAASDGSVYAGLYDGTNWSIRHFSWTGTAIQYIGSISLPALSSQMMDMTIGPDGQFWWVTLDVVGRTTTTGNTITYAPPTANPNLFRVVFGSDGNLYSPERITQVLKLTIGTGTQCNSTVVAPVGNDTFAITAYDSSMQAISTNTVPLTVSSGGPNTLNLSLNPVVNSATLSLGSPAFCNTTTLTLNARDVDGNTIVGTGAYVTPDGTPLTFTLAPNAANTTHINLTPASITSPALTAANVSADGSQSPGTMTATSSTSLAGGPIPPAAFTGCPS